MSVGRGRRERARDVEARALEKPEQLVGTDRASHRVVQVDDSAHREVGERLLHRLHAARGVRLHDRVDLLDLRLTDQVPDGVVGKQHLERGDAAGPVGRRQQRLRDDRLQRVRDHDANLLLLGRREDVDDPVDRRRGALGVQRAEDEVAGLGGRERGRDRLEVAHLADEDHVRVLAKRGLQRFREARRVRADLALVDDAPLVPVHELDRVLDREDMVGAGAVDLVDHRGERRRLTGARRPGDENETARVLCERVEHRRQAKLFERLDLLRDQTERCTDRFALVVDVDAEARDSRHRIGEVEPASQLEMLLLLAREDAVEKGTRVVRGERLEALGANDVPANPVRGRAADRHMEVGSAERDHLLEQVVDGSQLRHRSPSDELSARRCTALSAHLPRTAREANPPNGANSFERQVDEP